MPIETREKGLDPRERYQSAPSIHQESLASTYSRVRSTSTAYCKGLSSEDLVVQSMPDVSPTKWHLAHTSWFFETFLLQRFVKGYRPYCPEYAVLFNSYYNAVGEQFPRARRGLLSRPTVEEVFRYRQYVDRHMLDLLEPVHEKVSDEIAALVSLGLNHEQQHQELMLTDIKHVFFCNPLRPAFTSRSASPVSEITAFVWTERPGGLVAIGHDGKGFAYDNESPRHKVYVHPHRLATRLVTNKEYLAFMADGGYERAELWLSEGWAARQAERWSAPLYWELQDAKWIHMTLAGMREVEPHAPVCHVSFFEADAFARWCGARLPTEAEWETAAETVPCAGNFADEENFHPVCVRENSTRFQQLYGDVWEWTGSPYVAYPGYKPVPGAVGEYNGKFMCQQYVLRGGSCATSHSHVRPTYRNFFPPHARWQFSGFRLAADGACEPRIP